MKLIQRQGYLDFLRRNRERPIIKVVSGIRRCGKSTLFRPVSYTHLTLPTSDLV